MKPVRLNLSPIAAFCGFFAYSYGLVHLARAHWLFELAILLFPLFLLEFFARQGQWQSRTRLLFLESSFVLLCVVSKVSLSNFEGAQETLLNGLFGVFFVFQVGGFLAAQIKKKAYIAAAATSALGVGIAFWFFLGTGLSTSPEGGLLFFGGNAPRLLQAMYVTWFFCIMTTEYADQFPRGSGTLAHFASICVALGSGEFFHARILTAVHLLFLFACFTIQPIKKDLSKEVFFIPGSSSLNNGGRTKTIVGMTFALATWGLAIVLMATGG